MFAYLWEIVFLAVGGVIGFFYDKLEFIERYPMYVIIGIAFTIALIDVVFGGYVGIALAIGLGIGYAIYKARGGW